MVNSATLNTAAPVAPVAPAAPNGATYDPSQINFLTAYQAYEKAMAASLASPNDTELAALAFKAAQALKTAEGNLATGAENSPPGETPDDKAMLSDFGTFVPSAGQFVDAASFSSFLASVQNLAANPGELSAFEEQEGTFSTLYPFSSN